MTKKTITTITVAALIGTAAIVTNGITSTASANPVGHFLRCLAKPPCRTALATAVQRYAGRSFRTRIEPLSNSLEQRYDCLADAVKRAKVRGQIDRHMARLMLDGKMTPQIRRELMLIRRALADEKCEKRFTLQN